MCDLQFISQENRYKLKPLLFKSYVELLLACRTNTRLDHIYPKILNKLMHLYWQKYLNMSYITN